MKQFWSTIANYASNNVHSLGHLGWNLVKIIVLIIVAQIVIRIFSKIANRLLHMRMKKMEEGRKSTLQSVFQNIIKYSINFILLLTILPIFGVHIAALLAGAGVAGIAIAFGAQSLLKDFFNGLFILMENQFDVGDFVVLNGTWGQIRSIGLRITTLKVWTGELVIVPNGQISQVTNFSKENSIAVVDVNVGYNTNTETAIHIIQNIMDELKEEKSNIVGDVSVLGVQALNDSTYTIRATAECEPYTHFAIVRIAKQRIHQAFSEHQVDLPAQKIVYMYDKDNAAPQSSV